MIIQRSSLLLSDVPFYFPFINSIFQHLRGWWLNTPGNKHFHQFSEQEMCSGDFRDSNSILERKQDMLRGCSALFWQEFLINPFLSSEKVAHINSKLIFFLSLAMSLCFHTDTFIIILILYVSLMHWRICLLPLDIRPDVCISTYLHDSQFFQNVEMEFSEYHHDSLTLIFLVRLDEAIVGKSHRWILLAYCFRTMAGWLSWRKTFEEVLENKTKTIKRSHRQW